MAKLPLVANVLTASESTLRGELTEKYADYALAQLPAIRSAKSRGRCTAPHASILYQVCSTCFGFDSDFMLRLQLTKETVETMFHEENVARARNYLAHIARGHVGAAHDLWRMIHLHDVSPEEIGMSEDLLLQNPYYRPH